MMIARFTRGTIDTGTRDCIPGRVLMLLLGLFAVPGLVSPAYGSEFMIRNAEMNLSGNVYRLNAQIEYSFSEEALEALQNGVPLTLKLDIRVERKREYLWNERVASLVQSFNLQYHALTEQYILKNFNSGEQENFLSRSTAVSALGKIENLPVIDGNLLKPGQAYQVRLRARLDIESLPAPLRPWAWVSSDWHLSSDWYQWPLQL